MKTKKILTLAIAFLTYIASFAASPYLQDITLTSDDGTTLDFYADRYNKVVMHTPGTDFSHGGTFYVGKIIGAENGTRTAEFSIELQMSYGLKTLEGTIYYRFSDGYVYNVILNGYMFKSESRTVVSRRR